MSCVTYYKSLEAIQQRYGSFEEQNKHLKDDFKIRHLSDA